MCLRMEKERILITGGNGLLGIELYSYLNELGYYDVFSYGRGALDITDTFAITKAITSIKPHVIVNCAAVTNVDLCEYDLKTIPINKDAPYLLGGLAKIVGSYVIHISTNYVFSLEKEDLSIDDEINPINAYGLQKLHSEKILTHGNSCVLRVQNLIGRYGNSTLKQFLTADGDEIKAVSNMYFRPTSAYYLSEAIEKLITLKFKGIVHYASNGPTVSWYDIANQKTFLEYCIKKVSPINLGELNLVARRPLMSGLDSFSAKALGIKILDWEVHVNKTIEDIISDLKEQ